MKKILAALLAVVMIVSCMSVAFADTMKVWTMGKKDDTRWSVAINAEVKKGDVISFWVKMGEPAEGKEVSMYVRDSSRALYFDANGEYVLDDEGNPYEVYSGKYITDFAIAEADGWYYIVCESQCDSSALELSVDQAVTPSQIAGVKVNGVAVEVTTFGSAAAPVAEADMEEPVVAPEETEEVEETEDTADVEETGVVSIAVVAVAAVIGGAVVLKKREF